MADRHDAWNPGLTSDIPQRLWPKVTLFTDENAFVSYAEAKELSDLTGLTTLELTSLRPERLAKHALLVRVTADLTVADGPDYAQLGINLRSMVATIFNSYVEPELDEIRQAVEAKRDVVLSRVQKTIHTAFVAANDSEQSTASKPATKPSFWSALFAKKSRATHTPVAEPPSDIEALERLESMIKGSTCDNDRMCMQALLKCARTIVAQRGRLLPDHDLLARIVTNKLMNERASSVVDSMIDALWLAAVEAEGYRFLPVQSAPVVMNVKGASASGKSTIRPQQKHLAERLGIPWEDFALISPDYWRKYLIDYSSLGEDYQYGAMLSGRELEIVDKKLDDYIAKKASMKKMSHMLIDRFRFDSFALDIDRSETSRLLSRFANQVYLFFMVTHPKHTVERAWKRGNQTGRYKAVDDLLFHNVEAFTGMPALFLSWVNSKDKQIHFEYLDNDVPLGELPRTAAFGHNGKLVILDAQLMLNVDRYRKVNVSARSAEQVFEPADLDANANLDFAVQCAKTVEQIVFADQETMQAYAAVQNGKMLWWDSDYLQTLTDDDDVLHILAALGYSASSCHHERPDFAALVPEVEKSAMVGHWSAR